MKTYRKRNNFLSFMLLGIISLPSAVLSGPPYASLKETPEGFYRSQGITVQQKRKVKPREEKRYRLPHIGDAKDQGSLGTCVSFTIGACCEMLYPEETFSEAELTILTETQLPADVGGDCKSGLFLGNGLRVAQKFGLIPEDDLRYDPRYLMYVAKQNNIDTTRAGWRDRLSQKDDPDICSKADYNRTMRELEQLRLSGDGFRPIKFTAGASKYDYSEYRFGTLYEIRSHDFETTETLDKIKYHLSKNHPVAVGVKVYDMATKWNASPENPFINMPDHYSSHDGNHAIVLTGFDNDYGFSFRNSWGKTWGHNGFAWIPYKYIDKHATEIIGVGK